MNQPRSTAGEPVDCPFQGASDDHAGVVAGADNEYVLCLVVRDHYCPRSRELVGDVAGSAGSFADRNTAVVPVVPARAGRAAVWERRYDLPFGVVADPPSDDDGSFEALTAQLDHPPAAVLLEANGASLRWVRALGDDCPSTGPSVAALLDAVDTARTDGVASSPESGATRSQ